MSDFISKSRLKWAVEKWYEKEYYSSFNAAVYKALLKIIDRFPSVEQEKCGDCISRQAAIKQLTKLSNTLQGSLKDHTRWVALYLKNEIDFPSVEPERKTGKWIRTIDPDVNAWTGGHTCSECGRACVQMSMNYCANCGAKMEGKQALKCADNDTAKSGLQSAT